MITIPHTAAARLTAVLRAIMPAALHSGEQLPALLVSGPAGLLLRVQTADLAIELESVAAALERVASIAATVEDNDVLLARALYARFATERAIERVVMLASAALGGMSFIESPEVAYLLGATRALAFHPPSRAAAAGPIARYLAGGPLAL